LINPEISSFLLNLLKDNIIKNIFLYLFLSTLILSTYIFNFFIIFVDTEEFDLANNAFYK